MVNPALKVHRQPVVRCVMLAFLGPLAGACGDDELPIEVPFGETTFVVVVNPVINDANQGQLPIPGSAQGGVTVSVAGGPSGTTDGSGITVLSPVSAGSKTLSFSGGGTSGQLTVAIADGDLRELAVALVGGAASLMANLLYGFGGDVVEITQSMPVSQVNATLARSNVIVFFRAGSYTGDLQFSGSNVTLFGEGHRGGTVTLNGDVEVPGSRNRIRGARITGDLSVAGSDFGMSFSQVDGNVSIPGSGSVLLNNAFCGTITIGGSGATLLGNAGLAPIPQSSAGC